MKHLDITLTVKANHINEAELIGKRELMELAKVVGMHNGSSMACGSGKAEPIFNGQYEVTATVSIDGNGDINDIVKYMQRLWVCKSEIVNNMIFVSEEKREESPATVVCDECGQIVVKGYETIVNKGTDAEYVVCEECLDDLWGKGTVTKCEHCGNWIDNDKLIENPVMHKANICPVCGRIYNE